MTEALHTRFEYQAVWIDGDVLGVSTESTLDTWMLELQYRFGARGTARTPGMPEVKQEP